MSARYFVSDLHQIMVAFWNTSDKLSSPKIKVIAKLQVLLHRNASKCLFSSVKNQQIIILAPI